MTITDEWEDLPWEQFHKEVFHLQRRIYAASQNSKAKHQMHSLQKLMLRSWSAKYIAVKRVTELNRGRDTAGVDRVRSLTNKQKLTLAATLDIRQIMSPVKRVWIPKPGKNEVRPLGIPIMADRALQALIALALEPEWEARFTPFMHGFRKGRSAHDALASIRASIQRSPKWVLDADIEKFFDRVNHITLVKKLDTFPAMEKAIWRILRSGVIEGSVYNETEEGTPQGGPLSPLLANIALCGIDSALKGECTQWKLPNGTPIGRMPVIAIYADDFVVLHTERHVIERCRVFISAWLAQMGLRLHPEKTRIVHTLESGDDSPGFDFLGHHIRQFHTGKYAVKPSLNQVFTLIAPSKSAQTRVYAKVAECIDKMLCGKHGKIHPSREWLLIKQINQITRGWTNFFRHSNAKACFSSLDHKIWWKLWKALRRRHKKRGREWTVKTYLKRPGGKWQFYCRITCEGDDREITLNLFADTPITRYRSVRYDRVYYDGDWAYWGTRLGSYPTVPLEMAKCLKRQSGTCRCCRKRFTKHDRMILTPHTITVDHRIRIIQICTHDHCLAKLESLDSRPLGQAVDVASSPVR